MGAQPTTTPAIVTRGPGTWKVEDVQIDTNLQPREVLVEVTASGLCHTDLLFASLASEASASILGHEGKVINVHRADITYLRLMHNLRSRLRSCRWIAGSRPQPRGRSPPFLCQLYCVPPVYNGPL